jgi:hypothetical protein
MTVALVWSALALNTAGVPFARIVSCNPLEVEAPGIPPAFSGYPADDRSGWDAFRAEYDRTHRSWGGISMSGYGLRGA